MNAVQRGALPPLDMIIAIVPFLAGIPVSELEYFFGTWAGSKDLGAGEILFRRGDPLEHIYILFQGMIEEGHRPAGQPQRSQPVLTRTSTDGALIGHFDMLFRQPHSTGAHARSDSTLVELDVAGMNWLIHRYPDVRTRMVPFERINRLRTMPLIGEMPLTMLGFIAEASEIRPVSAREFLYRAGEPVDKFYMIDRGQVELDWSAQRQLLLGNGMPFGFDEPSGPFGRGVGPSLTDVIHPDHDARTTTDSMIFEIARSDFLSITGAQPDAAGARLRALSRQALTGISVFNKLDDQERDKLHGFCSYYHLPVHHVIMQQGEVADSMWILLPGSHAVLHALDGDNQALPSVPLSGLSHFGEVALVAQVPMHTTVETKPGSSWLRLHAQDFRHFLRLVNRSLDQELELSKEARESLGEAETRKRYSWLAAGETLIIFQRRHWIELVRKILPAIGVSLLILTLILLARVVPQNNIFFQCTYMGLIALAIGWTIWGVLDYLNDYLLVTNQRVVRQEKVIFFNEWQQVAFLEQIQNVDYITSFIGRMLNYGAIQIQTAGATGKIIFDYVPDPDKMKSIIIRQQGLRQRHYKASSRLVIQRLLEDRFGLRPRLPETVLPEGGLPVAAATPAGLQARIQAWMQPHMRMQQADHVIWRKHVVVLLPKIVGPFFTVLAAALLMISPGWLPLPAFEFGIAIELFGVVIAAVGLSWGAWVVADWRNDTYEVTATEVIDVEKKPLFFAEVRRSGRLGQIENIDVSLPSPLHFILNYGNVLLQTAATDGDFTFTAVPDPRGVSEELRRRIELYRRREEERRAQDRAQELPDWFESYNRLESDIIRDPADWG